MPIMPLKRKTGKALPDNPMPNPYAHTPNRSVAIVSRQKFASVPPMSFAERCPHTTEIENRIVVRKAANTGRNLMGRAAGVESCAGQIESTTKHTNYTKSGLFLVIHVFVELNQNQISTRTCSPHKQAFPPRSERRR